MTINNWFQVAQMNEKKWVCGYCGTSVAGHLGYYRHPNIGGHFSLDHMPKAATRIVICPGCEKPTYFEGENYWPGVAYGRPIKHLPPEIEEVYTQARQCMSVNGYVPAVLAARTILMHIAVNQGAKEGENFTVYVDHLVSGGFVPPNAKPWVDHVRAKGNAATHRIALMSKEDAEKVLRFIEMILLFLYEYPNLV